MRRDSRTRIRTKATPFDADTIEATMRNRIRETIELLVDEELTAALGAGASARVGRDRRGYRHGTRVRQLTSSLGPTTFALPRAPRAAGRHDRRVAEPAGAALSAAHAARGRGALGPLPRRGEQPAHSRRAPAAHAGGPLSKDAVSRVVGRLKDAFVAWRARDLAAERIRYLFLDGWFPIVRVGQRRARVPVLVTLGVTATGERRVLDLRLAGAECAAAWREVIESLVSRHLGVPTLAVIDGNPALATALRAAWPKIQVQRCTVHKLRNLLAKASRRLHEELTEDYRRMVYAATPDAVLEARKRFRTKWRRVCPGVVTSLDEAGDDLFTFLAFPPSQWKALRTTNALERINEEFRRRTKTQTMLPSEDAVLVLLFGLLHSGAITLRRLDGWRDLVPPSAPASPRQLHQAA
jgi:transposase-like protein